MIFTGNCGMPLKACPRGMHMVLPQESVLKV